MSAPASRIIAKEAGFTLWPVGGAVAGAMTVAFIMLHYQSRFLPSSHPRTLSEGVRRNSSIETAPTDNGHADWKAAQLARIDAWPREGSAKPVKMNPFTHSK